MRVTRLAFVSDVGGGGVVIVKGRRRGGDKNRGGGGRSGGQKSVTTSGKEGRSPRRQRIFFDFYTAPPPSLPSFFAPIHLAFKEAVPPPYLLFPNTFLPIPSPPPLVDGKSGKYGKGEPPAKRISSHEEE